MVEILCLRAAARSCGNSQRRAWASWSVPPARPPCAPSSSRWDFASLCFLGSTVSCFSVPAVSHCRISAVQFPARQCRSEVRVRLLLAQAPCSGCGPAPLLMLPFYFTDHGAADSHHRRPLCVGRQSGHPGHTGGAAGQGRPCAQALLAAVADHLPQVPRRPGAHS